LACAIYVKKSQTHVIRNGDGALKKKIWPEVFAIALMIAVVSPALGRTKGAPPKKEGLDLHKREAGKTCVRSGGVYISPKKMCENDYTYCPHAYENTKNCKELSTGSKKALEQEKIDL